MADEPAVPVSRVSDAHDDNGGSREPPCDSPIDDHGDDIRGRNRHFDIRLVIEPKYPYILNGHIHYTTSRSIRMAVKASFGFSTDDSRPRYVQIWWDRCSGSWVYGSSLITHDDNSHQYR